MDELIKLKTNFSESRIFIGKGALEKNLKDITGGRDMFLLTDSNVHSLYRELIEKNFNCPKFILKAGESSKSFKSLRNILKAMTGANLKRNSLLVALGGGVIGDIGGLSGALYMRGIEVLQIPTTLLSQVDSSVGGKTAVNFFGTKNIIGAFYQPKNVICDSDFLNTLTARELRCGLGEIIKTAALNGGLFDLIDKNLDKINDLEFIKTLVSYCVKHKAAVVESDEKEISGERKTLNLGHTTAHALELSYKEKSHGEYVLEGMLFEMYIAYSKKMLSGEYMKKLERMIKSVINTPKYYKNIEKAMRLAIKDKKNTDENISIIAPKGRGESVEIILPFYEYSKLIGEYNEKNK